MKFLHTSDWHLGHSLYNFDRSTEQQAFLKQLTEKVRTLQPDALLVSGDIYHYASPSTGTQRMYTDAMLAIHEACPSMQIIVTAGNHDSSSRLEIDRNLWERFQVHVIGNIERKNDRIAWEKHIIPLTNTSGQLTGYVVAVPHCYPQNFPALHPDIPREERLSDFFQTLLKETEKQNTAGVPVILMAHLALTGSDITGHDDTVGGMDYLPIEALGDGYDYLALGHIHCPQTIRNTQKHARYCGSPLPVSFDEAYPHSVTWVEIDRHSETPRIQTLSIENPFPLITLPETPAPFEIALKALQAFPADNPSYIRLNVLLKDYLSPDCNEQASLAVREKSCRFCYIRTQREQSPSSTANPVFNLQEIKQQSPLEIAGHYYKEATGETMDDKLRLLMKTAMEAVHQDEQQP
ncbi:exonuclease SbcCD subunit D [uncultured Phocaeicola sp.]|uniref:exonuclease SbcCD subunit D n=1 Tax=uncultured Phocaeicola sp. TaxID=990718 RepID=UPI0025EF8A37|nr:exonuclease SbcCD subunit D [uncultured Phocaeicola sp.]